LPNEKTLELNITHEILEICRRYDPRAFALGTTLVQESHQGYDSKIIARFSPSWLTSPLQYKKPVNRKSLGTNTFEYIFDINNNTYHDQHLILYHHLAGGKRRVAFYALPAIFTNAEFYSSLPILRTRTFLVDVTEIQPHWVDNQTHRLHLFPHLRMALLHSTDEIKIETLSLEEFEKLVARNEIGLPIYAMMENMKMPFAENLKTESKRPRFLFNIFPR